MKTQNLLFVSLMVAGNLAFAETSATTTNQVDLHASQAVVAGRGNVANTVYITAPRAANATTTTYLVDQYSSSSIKASATLQANSAATPRVIDTNAPTTTNLVDLHNVQASVATMQRAQDLRAKKIADKLAQN